MKLLLHSSLGYSLVNFRGDLLRALRRQGHEVIATAPDDDSEIGSQLAKMGVRFVRVPMARASLRPLADLRTLFAYVRLMQAERPDVVIAYTQKPIIYGGLATRLFPRTRFYVIMSGLGFVFSAAADHRKLLRKLVGRMYREAVRHARGIFVFNSDDRREMMQHGIIDPRQKVVQVPGSGVSTDRFGYEPLPEGPPTMLLIARLMRDKGIYDFIEAAKLVKERYPDARFQILGKPEEDNPTGLGQQEIDEWSQTGIVEFLPETTDVRPHLAASTIFVLPSYYREGLPRTILEALSTGRPVVTTDMPGCRDAIMEGENGKLVPPKSPGELATAIMELLADRKKLEAMSRCARETAEKTYDVNIVNAQLLDLMGLAERQAPGSHVDTRTHDPDRLVLQASKPSGAS